MPPDQTAIGSDELSNPRVQDLLARIRESFRVRENHKPVYVDVGGNLARVRSKQHQIIFGRRGSGKSCLLIHFVREAERKREHKCVYIQVDEYKRLAFPDVLIRFLIALLEATPISHRRLRKFFGRIASVDRYAADLRRLLDQAEVSEVVDQNSRERDEEAKVNVAAGPAAAQAGARRRSSSSQTASYRFAKLDEIERHLRDYKSALVAGWKKAGVSQVSVVVDDFYLLELRFQPDVIDYLHRLLRDTDLYLKVATVRHRTSLVRNHPQTVGVELQQDIEPLDLDRTLDDLPSTQSFLAEMLDSLGRSVGLERASERLFNPEGLQALSLASGGVPRDFLAILMNAIDIGINSKATRWLTPTLIYKGARQLEWNSKRTSMRNDVKGDAAGLERLLTDLLAFCLKEQRKTAFLIGQDDAQANPDSFELIQQLMDFKLIHVVEQNTSAASGRAGRFIAYTLDLSFFMEPRLRKIEIVEFWKIDEGRRRVGIREAPVYELARARAAYVNDSRPSDPTLLLAEVEEEGRTGSS